MSIIVVWREGPEKSRKRKRKRIRTGKGKKKKQKGAVDENQ